MEFKNFYATTHHRKFNTWCKRTQRLDTYGCGCQHNCHYCYAKGLLNFRGFWDNLKPRVSDIHKIKPVVKYLSGGEVVRLGGMTDCFQPIEITEKVTYKAIKLLNEHKVPYLIVTKSSLVATDEYVYLYDKNLAHFQVTITNTSDSEAKKYEHCSSTSSRIFAIEKLQRFGFDVSIRLSPFIDSFVDYGILNNIKCDKILIEFLKVNHSVKKHFNIDYSDYSLKYGGYENLQLNKKIELVNKITGFKQVSVGEYVKSHYHYFRDHVNYNKVDCCNLTGV